MLTPTEAARTILEHVAPLAPERRPLREALDLVLAEAVTSPLDLPAWDNSAMDGYAVRAADVREASPERPVTLAVIETVAAGRFPTRPVGPGQATRIFTGAPLPAGASVSSPCARAGTRAATCAAGARTSAGAAWCSRRARRSARAAAAPSTTPTCNQINRGRSPIASSTIGPTASLRRNTSTTSSACSAAAAVSVG